MKINLFILFIFINSLISAELKIADDFKDGDVLSASVFNQIFNTIEKINGTIADTDLVGTWICSATTTRNSSGWTQDGFLYKLNDTQVNLIASSSATSLENPYSISTSSPNPFKRTSSSAFTGTYVLYKNKLITKTSGETDARIWDIDLISKTRFELTFLETSAQSFPTNYSSFISCDSASAVPASPTAPSAVNNKTSIVVSWTDSSSDESGFKIYRKKSGESNFNLVSTQTSLTYTDTNLDEGDLANYYIKSYNSNGDSAQSNVVVATMDSISPSVSSSSPSNNGNMSRQASQTVSFTEEIEIVCPDGDNYTSVTCPTSGFAISLSISVDGSLRNTGIGSIGNKGINISGSAGRGSAERYDGNQNNIIVTVNKDWIKDLNGNKMSSDYQFSINVNNTLDNPSCPPNC